jgi:hypothetical protein
VVVEAGEAEEAVAVVAVAVVVAAVVAAPVVAEEAQAVGVGEEADREVEVKEGWEECALVQGQAGSASAPPVTLRHPIRRASPALTGIALSVESG